MRRDRTRRTALHAARLTMALLALGAAAALTQGRAGAATTTVQAGNYWFCNVTYANSVCPTTVRIGDTVTWLFPSGIYHTATECGGMSCDDAPPATPEFDSGLMFGGMYSHVFDTPGTFLYQCNIHGALMRGTVTVSAAVGGVAELPDAAGAPLAQSEAPGAGGVVAAVVVAAAGAGALGGLALWYGRRRDAV